VKLFELKVADGEEEAFLEAVSKMTKDTGSGGRTGVIGTLVEDMLE
jgi:hypothetical protein